MNARKLVSLSALVAVAVLGCLTPKQAADVTEASCKVVSSLVDGVPDSICATAPELAAIGAMVYASRQYAGPDGPGRTLASCRMVPEANVCATELELAAAIRAVRASR